jgi:hypothetical protein
MLNLSPDGAGAGGDMDVIARDPRWERRGLRWVLHQLAVGLAPLDPRDPAALALAGLPPGSRAPSFEQEPPTPDEQQALRRICDAVVAALVQRLAPANDDRAAILDRVIRRPARIVADPGWFEVRFALDDVSIEVRRAGLDVDPNWVPWLGIVLRFAYV